METIDKFTTIAEVLFGGLFAALLLGLVVVGAIVGRRARHSWIGAVILVVGLFGTYGWFTMFVFPYPPNSGSAPTWMMAGWTLSPAAMEYLAKSPEVAGYDAERRNGELTYAFGGDVQKVWEGRSMEAPKYAGQVCLILVVLGLAWVLTSLGVTLFGPKKT